MPIYEYKCEMCGKVTEFFHHATEQQTSPPVCSACGSPKLHKLLSTPGMVKIGDGSPPGTTRCGREERCDTPPCSDDGACRRDMS